MSIEAHEERELLRLASEVRERAYAPFSRFRVGAAVLTESGGVHHGCNVENASYGLTICAERAAVCAAVAAEGPAMRLRAVAVTCGEDGDCSPCGACRQVIAEFGAGTPVYMLDRRGVRVAPIGELLPLTFRL